MPREAAIVDQLLKFLNGLPQALFRKKHGTMFGVTGDPDLFGAIQGRMVQIEVKQPGKKPTPLQMRRLLEWERAGVIAFWVQDLAQVKERLKAEGLYSDPVFGGMGYQVDSGLEASESALRPKEGGSRDEV